MNKDFRATNPDRNRDARAVEGARHRLAHPVQARRGHPHEDDADGFTHDDGVKKAATGGIAPFDPKTHLNFWVCALTGGLLGYAQFPGGPAATDGVVINYQAFGTNGHGAGAVQQGPHGDPRSRTLSQPAPHLGRHAGLQRLRHGGRHAQLRRPELRHADLSRSSPATTARTATCS